ncbi:MAG: hypothetical protein CL927_07925 [Deltaproteobacteria bacterium]|nr:hypothetical protein [Deltaproteobacteria bacterium]HCH66337.1 hypothetical protein [Deltaproteobacteria bacterium]
MVAETKRMPRGLKLLLFFSALMFLCVLVGTMLSLGGLAWALLPGPQTDTRYAIDEDTVAVVHLNDLGDDPEVRELVRVVFRSAIEVAQADKQNQPAVSDWQIDLTVAQMTLMTTAMMPEQATLVVDRHPAGDDRHWTLVANLPMGPRVVDLYLSQEAKEEGRSIHEDGHDFTLLEPSQKYISFHEGTAVWSSHLAQSKQIHRRLDARAQSTLARQVTELAEQWSVVAVVHDAPLLMRLVGIDDASEPLKESISMQFAQAEVGLRVNDADSAEMQVRIETSTTEGVEQLATSMDALCEALRANVAQTAVVFSCTSTLGRDDLTLNARYQNLQAVVATRLAAVRHAEKHEPPSSNP